MMINHEQPSNVGVLYWCTNHDKAIILGQPSSMGRADHFPCHTVCPRKYEFGKGISHVCLKTEEKWIQQLNPDLVQLGLLNVIGTTMVVITSKSSHKLGYDPNRGEI